MTEHRFTVKDGQGAHALDMNQLFSRLLGRGVIGGGGVTAGAGKYVVEVENTSVYLNNERHDIDPVTLDLEEHVDNRHPLKALIAVGTEGEIFVAPGEPEEPQPRTEFRFNTFRPAPPDLSATDAVVLAEVWLDPTDIRLTDADIRDRRLDADLDVYSVTANTVDVTELIDGNGVAHTGELAGENAAISEDDVREAINTDEDHGETAPHNYFSGSHDDLSDVGPEDHHPRFSDSEARDAVRGSLDAADLTADSGTAGDHIEYTGSALEWTQPPDQQATVINSGTVTHTGGASTEVLLAGVTSDETADFEIAVGVDQPPSWDGDYSYSVDVSRQWDDANGEVDVQMTLTWDTDPGTGNDLVMSWTAFETSPVVVEGRYTDADAIAAMDGASIAPDRVSVASALTGPLHDDISAVEGEKIGDIAVASGNGPSTFGQYLYDGESWIGPFGTSVTSLSELNIDVAKDWGGHAIQNVGAPSNATDAARQQEINDHAAITDAHHSKTTSDEIDHTKVSNVESDQHHERYSDQEAVEATSGRVFSSSVTGASIPNEESHQNFHYVPSGETLRLVRAEVVDKNGQVPDGLSIQLFDRDTEETIYSQNQMLRSHSLSEPLATVSGERNVAVRIVNLTGAEIAASGSMNFEIS